MPGIILHDEDVYRLAQSVNTKQTEGYAPMGGILANNGMYYQPMVTGNVTAQYIVVREQDSQNFIARSETTTGSALGDIQYVDGFFLQAFGEEPGGGVLPPSQGGTGVTDLGQLRRAILVQGVDCNDQMGPQSYNSYRSPNGAFTFKVDNSGLVAAITSGSEIVVPFAISAGGTGATTAAAAWTALGGGAVGKLAALPKGVAVPDAAAAPTMEEFNALLASLRAAGYLAS